MDVLVCNGLGIYCGMKTLEWLSLKTYKWQGLWNIPTYKYVVGAARAGLGAGYPEAASASVPQRTPSTRPVQRAAQRGDCGALPPGTSRLTRCHLSLAAPHGGHGV